MATIDIKDVAGKTVKSVELNDAVFGIEPNIHVMHTVVRAYRAGLRGVRRAPVVPARVPSAPLSGLAAAPCSVPTPVLTRSA